MRYAKLWTYMAAFAGACAGCATYTTPGGPAEISMFADPDVRQVLQRKPAAQFPANLAVVRVQEPGYKHHDYYSYGRGKFSAALASDIETDDHLRRVQALPQVEGVVRLNRLVLPEKLDSEADMRLAAARLRADMVLLYTLDTDFFIEGKAEPLTVLTLGWLPNQQAHIATNASALLIDTQTGFVYGAADAKSTHKQIANVWTTREAIDQSRRKTEVQAFESLVTEVEKLWPGVVAEHGQRRKAQAEARN